MKIQVCEIGADSSRVVVIDDFLGDPDALVRQAKRLAPYPEVEGNYYPGVRRLIRLEDGEAFSYVDGVCDALAPVLRQVWGIERFRITEASFSMVTRQPGTLDVMQRMPHYDSLDPDNFAVLHYLSRNQKGGTAFYRHRRSGFDMISGARSEAYGAALLADFDELGPPKIAYFDETTEAWEKIGAVDWRFNRLLIYQGALFHSGLIPPDFDFSPDPMRGRLTGNIFLNATAKSSPSV